MGKTRIFIFCAVLCAQAFGQESRTVRTSQGLVKGYKDDGVYEFYNIPYASAPIGRNKFKEPNPGPVWLDTFVAIAKDKEIICPQDISIPGLESVTQMQEDCLIANVFVPDTDKTNLPVLVIVHGGGYQIGSGLMFTQKSLVQSKEIIAVSFNYRLSTHGFLCLGTEDIPGNAGMKDQVALLRWVQKNIKAFGGNPNDVTINGFSAGSSAVDLLQLSKTTKGLFNKVILESGANVGAWSVQVDPLKVAKEFARKIGFQDVDDIYALEVFYKTTSLKILQSPMPLGNFSSFGFSPCIERDTGKERILEDAPVNILKSGNYEKLPMLYGFSEKEGLLRLAQIEPLFESYRDKMNKKFSDFLPSDLHFKNDDEKEEVARKVKEFYFSDKPVSEETLYAAVDYFTDVDFAFGTLRSVKLQVEAGNNQIYLYEYSFVGEDNLPPNPNYEKLGIKGAEHGAQSFALHEVPWFGIKDESLYSERTKKMRATMRGLWLNFIVKGSPVPQGSSFPSWPPADVTGSPHMSLDEKLELRGPLLEKRMRLWDDIYAKYYRSPVPPPAPPSRHSEL